jgi:putative hydrolase of the HAD superfamily
MFDIGGVLMYDFHNEYYCNYLSRLSGMPFGKVKGIINGREVSLGNMGMITKDELETRLAERLGIRQSQVKWFELYRKHAKLNKPVFALVRRLHRRYATAYLSNIDRSKYEYTMKLFRPYLGLFDYRFASFAIGMQKPYNAVYNYALARMRTKASEVVFVDNQKDNVVGAEEVGIHAILFRGIEELERELGKITRF